MPVSMRAANSENYLPVPGAETLSSDAGLGLYTIAIRAGRHAMCGSAYLKSAYGPPNTVAIYA